MARRHPAHAGPGAALCRRAVRIPRPSGQWARPVTARRQREQESARISTWSRLYQCVRVRLMRRLFSAFFFLAASVFAQSVDIPFQKFVLANGLTLIVHEDHKAPIVAVNVWYHVGSKNEKPGKTGFAHLFEHIMFGGSEHAPGSYIKALESVGATDL